MLAGRDTELAVIDAVLAGSDPDRSVLLVEGSAGIGKSSLLREARERAVRLGRTVLTARADTLEQDFAFGMVRQLFERQLYGDPARARQLLTGSAALAAPVFGIGGPSGTDDDLVDSTARPGRELAEASFAVLHGLYWLAADLAADNPLVLILDDLQWADVPSLRWLRYLTLRLEGLPIVVIAARRTGDPTEEVDASLDLDRMVEHRLPLDGLDEEPAVALGREVLGEAGDPVFWTACHEATTGNPFLLRALLRGCQATGTRPTAQAAREIGRFGPPEVAGLARQVLAQLGEPAAQLATVVALLGDNADPGLLEPLTGMSRSQAANLVTALSRTWLFDGVGQQISFAHSIVRSAILNDVPPSELAELRLRLARTLHDRTAPVEQVATHLLPIPPTGERWVATALEAAAADALRRGAPESTARYLRRVLDEPLDPATAARLQVELGQVELGFDARSARGHLGTGLDGPLDPPRRARASIALAHTWFDADPGELPAASDALRRQYLSFDPADTGFALLLEIEWIYLSIDHVDTVDTVLPRLSELTLEQGIGTPAECSLAGLLAYRDLMAGTDREAALRHARHALQPGRFPEDDAFVRNRALLTMIVAGEPAEVVAACDSAIEQARRRGSMRAYTAALSLRTEANHRLGRLADCHSDIQACVAARTAGNNTTHGHGNITASRLVDVYIEQGRFAEADEVLTATGMQDTVPGQSYLNCMVLCRGQLRIAQGRLREGLSDLLECGSRALAGRHPTSALLPWRSEAALAHWALGETEAAVVLADEELTLARRWGTPEGIGVALRAVGIVNPGPDGLAHLRESVRLLATSPARLDHARAATSLGAALRRAGHGAEARDVLREAIELARGCGSTTLTATAEAELRTAGARPRTAAFSGMDSLTPTERRVAELAATGLTNRDIAQRLFVGLRTVEIHLTSAYRKLHVTGRAELSRHFDQPRHGRQPTAPVG